MTLNASGPISLGGSTTGQSINLELGVSATALASINSSSFRTLAGVASGQISLSNFYGKSNILTGQTEYDSNGTYTWVCPSGVTSISILCIGQGGNGATSGYFPGCGCCGPEWWGGGGGGGGGLAYYNNYAVTPGNSYTVQLSSMSAFKNGATVVVFANWGNAADYSNGGAGADGGGIAGYVAWSGGDGRSGDFGGGSAAVQKGGGGGGAGGYAGKGGNGGNQYNGASAGAGGGGGGGGGATSNTKGAAGGGGVGKFGQGANGSAGNTGTSPTAGGGGSGGTNGTATGTTSGGPGGTYGGGGGGGSGFGPLGSRGGGLVRMIYPGSTRSYPSTNTGNL